MEDTGKKRIIAEASGASGAVVTCTGGSYLDAITEKQIREVQETAAEIASKI